MEIDRKRIEDLIARPTEGLAVEVKPWIDPESPEGAAKIVRAALALRNQDGGYLVIGFTNNFEPAPEPPADVRLKFNVDRIQSLIAKYSSQVFEVAVEFVERDRQIYPVIAVPSGVRTPVATRQELKTRDGKKTLVAFDEVYVRSLNANFRASTTRATHKDWEALIERCFENRTADVGRFIRRHLSGMTGERVRELIAGVESDSEPADSDEGVLQRLLREGLARYQEVVAEKKLVLPKFGTWEVALKIVGQSPEHKPSREFLNLLDSSNPDYTGWPVWLVSLQFRDPKDRPWVYQGRWEALIAEVSGDSGWGKSVDFLRYHPVGEFYLLRALEDDIKGTKRAPSEPFSELDFGLTISRTAEALAVGLAYAKALQFDSGNTTLQFAFRWSGLTGRILTSWANPSRMLRRESEAYENEITAFTSIPLTAPLSAVAENVYQVVNTLFAAFDGFQISKGVVEDITRRLLERRS